MGRAPPCLSLGVTPAHATNAAQRDSPWRVRAVLARLALCTAAACPELLLCCWLLRARLECTQVCCVSEVCCRQQRHVMKRCMHVPAAPRLTPPAAGCARAGM